MSLGAVIGVAIGLIFCFLLLAMIGSALQEALAGWLRLRARGLRNGLKELLQHEATGGTDADALFNKVYRHGLIAPVTLKREPSYVPARNFCAALIDAFGDGSQATLYTQIENGVARLPNGATKESLTALVIQANGDIDALRTSIATWFDDAMDRVSGVYKRFSNNYMLVFGLAAAVALNIDAIRVAQALWTDPGMRDAVAQAAAAMTAPAVQDKSSASLQVAANALATAPFPIGWSSSTHVGLNTVLGWIITAFAVSLGAPFWFDALQNVLNLRTSGPKPPRSDATTEDK